MLEVKGIRKEFKSTIACENISFRVEDGEFFVLLGPSGCGKTTILRLIAGLEEIDKGEIVLNDRKLETLSVQERNVAMVFQNYSLYPNMTVRQNLEFPLKMRKLQKREMLAKVNSIAVLLQISDLLDKNCVKLSGGQQQRVAVGRALVRKPEVFLLDEPLSNLDAKLRQHLRVELARVHKELNITTIYVTHDQSEALTLADRIAVIKEGQIQQIGIPEEIYAKPANMFIAGFIGFPEINMFDGQISDGKLNVLGRDVQEIRELPDMKRYVKVAVRPEDVLLAEDGSGWEVEVELKEIAGPEIILYLRKGDLTIRSRMPKEKAEILARKGQKLNINFKMANLLFFDPETGGRIL